VTALRGRLKTLAGYSGAMFAIALPVMFQSAAEYIFVFTDMAFVGQYDQRGLSALNNAMAPFFAVMSFFFALTQGVTILVSQRLGAGRTRAARRTAETALFYINIASWAVGIFWEIAAQPVLELMGAHGDTLKTSVEYLKILALQFLTLGLGATAGCLFQALGKTVPVMATVIAKSVLNVILNWVLIFGHWGSPELGVAGSALGTALSTVIFDLVLVGVLFTAKYRRTFHLRWRAIFKPKTALFGQVLKLGVPVGFEYMLWTGGQAVLIALVNRVDTVSSGWFGVLNTLMVLSIQVYNGIGVATLVLIGRASGAGDKKKVRYLSAYGMASAMAACVLVGAVFVLWPHAVLSLFLTDPAARTELIPLLWLSAVIMFFKALNIIAGNSLRGTGDTLWMMYTQAGGTVIIIGVAAWLVFGLHWGITALMIAVLVDELCRGVVNEAKFLSK